MYLKLEIDNKRESIKYNNCSENLPTCCQLSIDSHERLELKNIYFYNEY